MNMKQLANNFAGDFLGLESEFGMKKKFQADHVNYVSSEQENWIISLPANINLKPGTLFLLVLSGPYFKHMFICFYFEGRKRIKTIIHAVSYKICFIIVLIL